MKSLKNIDPATTAIPFAIILVLCLLFVISPEASGSVLSDIRSFLGDELGLYYLVVGLSVFLVSMYIAFSRYGKIRLGGPHEKPAYSGFTWGAMMFTSVNKITLFIYYHTFIRL